MSFMHLAFSSDAPAPLSTFEEGDCGTVVGIRSEHAARGYCERLFALGVTPGAHIRVLQTFPGIVFLCDQTELAVERAIAHTILVRSAEVES